MHHINITTYFCQIFQAFAAQIVIDENNLQDAYEITKHKSVSQRSFLPPSADSAESEWLTLPAFNYKL